MTPAEIIYHRRVRLLSLGIRTFVDEGLGHSSYLFDLGDGTAAS